MFSNDSMPLVLVPKRTHVPGEPVDFYDTDEGRRRIAEHLAHLNEGVIVYGRKPWWKSLLPG